MQQIDTIGDLQFVSCNITELYDRENINKKFKLPDGYEIKAYFDFDF